MKHLPLVAAVGAIAIAATPAIVRPREAPPAVPPIVATRGAMTITVGSAFVPSFAIRTDTILAVRHRTDPTTGAVTAFVRALKCGTSVFFLRGSPYDSASGISSTAIAGDSETVTVIGCGSSPPAPAPVASVSVCFMDPAVAAQLGVSGDTTIDPSKLPPGTCNPTATIPAPTSVPSDVQRLSRYRRIAERH